MTPQTSWPRRRLDALALDATLLRDSLAANYLRRLSEAERDRCRDSLALLADVILAMGQRLEDPGIDALREATRHLPPFARRAAA